MDCSGCGHPEEDHHGFRSDGTEIEGNLCYHEENQGHSEDLCPCSGFNKDQTLNYFETVLLKAGA